MNVKRLFKFCSFFNQCMIFSKRGAAAGKSVIFCRIILDIPEKSRYNTMACVCGHILAPDEIGGQKSKRRCKQHG